MRITLNTRSTEELAKIMKHYKITNPTHMVQVMISQLYKSIPTVEDNNSETINPNRDKA